MSDLIKKKFLDEEGLALYDELIKEYIKSANDAGGEALEKESERAQAAEQAIIDSLVELGGQVGVEKLDKGETVIDYIDKSVEDAVEKLVDGAPEALDTLKEVADWIKSDETASAALIEQVKANEAAIAENAENIEAVYQSIGSIEELKIRALFMNKVAVKEEQTVAEAIADLKANEILVLEEGAKIEEDLVVPAGAIIDANGAELAGAVEVSKDAVIQNAVFTGEVTVK